MRMSQWIRCYDSKNDSLIQEWLISEFEEIPEYWVECLLIEHKVACAILGENLMSRGREYFLEMDI